MTSTAKPVCFYSSSWRGGDGWFSHALAEHLATALAPQGRALLYVASRMEPAEREAKGANLRRLLIPTGAHVRGSKLRKAVATAVRIGCATAALLRARLSTRDFLITHAHWLSAILLQFSLLRLLGTRIIYAVHDPLPHAWRFPPWAQGLEKWLVVLSYRLSSQIVMLTETGRAKMIELGIPAERVSVIPHGIFASAVEVPMRSNRRFLIFGMLRRNKCILESIQAFAQVHRQYPDSQLVIAGAPYSAEPDYWAQCQAALDALDAVSVQREIGFVEESRMEQLFIEADAVLAPYTDFNSQSGVAVLAAFSMRPVIGSAIGGIGELFDAGMAGVRIDKAPTAEVIAQAMAAFCARPVEAWRREAAEGRNRIMASMSWEAVGRAYAKLIAQPPA